MFFSLMHNLVVTESSDKLSTHVEIVNKNLLVTPMGCQQELKWQPLWVDNKNLWSFSCVDVTVDNFISR